MAMSQKERRKWERQVREGYRTPGAWGGYSYLGQQYDREAMDVTYQVQTPGRESNIESIPASFFAAPGAGRSPQREETSLSEYAAARFLEEQTTGGRSLPGVGTLRIDPRIPTPTGGGQLPIDKPVDRGDGAATTETPQPYSLLKGMEDPRVRRFTLLGGRRLPRRK